MIDIVENEPLVPHIKEFDGILIGTNCYQVMRNGFQYEITQQIPEIKEANYQTKYGDSSKLGTVTVWDKYYLMFISFGFNVRGTDSPFIDYEAFRHCIQLINIRCKGQHLASTMIGCTSFDGNADPKIILDILTQELTKVDLTLFDYKQETGNTIRQRNYFANR